MKPRVLVSAPYAMPIIGEYRRRLKDAGCEVKVANVRESLNEKDLLGLVHDVDGMICGDDQITVKVLDAAPRLKVISKWGTGIDSIDREAAAARGIAVRNTPDAFTEPVADMVLGYMLLFARKLVQMDQDIRAGRWVKPQLVSLRETTLGIVGVGCCGKAVARRAAAFGMTLLGNDTARMPANFLASMPIRMTSLEDLLRASDFVSLNADLNPASRHIINAKTLKLMKPSAYLINMARGGLVDEPALIRALKAKAIAGAALDVFEKEPLPKTSPLRRIKTCFLSPHNANSSPLASARVHDNTIKNLLDGLKG